MLRTPSGPGIRDDGGVYEGWTVPIDYDPLISKLVAWGASREEAIARMRRALQEYRVEGIQTNIAFFDEILQQEEFRKGDFDTGFIDRWVQNRKPRAPMPQAEHDLALLAAAVDYASRNVDSLKESASGPSANPWKSAGRLGVMRK
jgi:acetyl-CoA carboxylase biotin carboxylase subunit